MDDLYTKGIQLLDDWVQEGAFTGQQVQVTRAVLKMLRDGYVPEITEHPPENAHIVDDDERKVLERLIEIYAVEKNEAYDAMIRIMEKDSYSVFKEKEVGMYIEDLAVLTDEVPSTTASRIITDTYVDTIGDTSFYVGVKFTEPCTLLTFVHPTENPPTTQLRHEIEYKTDHHGLVTGLTPDTLQYVQTKATFADGFVEYSAVITATTEATVVNTGPVVEVQSYGKDVTHEYFRVKCVLNEACQLR